MAKKKETVFKERIRPLLDALPRSWWVKTQMLAVLGIPDFIGCVNGYFVAIELKKDGSSKASAIQEWVLGRIQKSGGIGLVVSPDDWAGTFRMLVDLASGKLAPEREGDEIEVEMSS